jgi:predicted nucleic acid-binding protein
VPATISSRDLTVEQFAELIDACEALAKELKVKLIYPMDYRFARYGNEKN